MLIALAQILAGFVLLVWAADRLITGASALARNLGVSPLMVGLTIVGFGTSAPELVVSAMAALRGSPSLAVGNAIGSNIANIGLILGLTAMIYPLRVEPTAMKREMPVLGMAMVLTLALMWNLTLSRFDGATLLVSLVLVMCGVTLLGLRRGKQDPVVESLAAGIPGRMSSMHAGLWVLFGLTLLPLSSHVMVTGAVTLATLIGVSEAVVGLTIVAFGTSLPELAAALISAVKKEDDIAIGNIIGSNLFNLLGVLGIAAVLHPMVIERFLLYRDLSVMFLITVVLVLLIWRRGGTRDIGRASGAVLFLMFASYIGLVVWQAL